MVADVIFPGFSMFTLTASSLTFYNEENIQCCCAAQHAVTIGFQFRTDSYDMPQPQQRINVRHALRAFLSGTALSPSGRAQISMYL